MFTLFEAIVIVLLCYAAYRVYDAVTTNRSKPPNGLLLPISFIKEETMREDIARNKVTYKANRDGAVAYRIPDDPGVVVSSMPIKTCASDGVTLTTDINQITDWENGGNLFVSNYYTAHCPATLAQYNIGAIVTVHNITSMKDIYTAEEYGKVPIMYINIDDQPNVDISKYFDDVYAFVNEQIQGRCANVLIHCHMGISRSISMAMSYIMKRECKPYGQVLKEVKSKRWKAWPNSGFEQQLKAIHPLISGSDAKAN